MKIGQLNILQQMFDTVIIPQAVYKELTSNPLFISETEIIEQTPYIVVEKVKDRDFLLNFRESTGLDEGESESISLYFEKHASLLLIDEHKGRSYALANGCLIMGTIGLLIDAMERNIITTEECKHCKTLLQNGSIRLSKFLLSKLDEKINEKITILQASKTMNVEPKRDSAPQTKVRVRSLYNND